MKWSPPKVIVRGSPSIRSFVILPIRARRLKINATTVRLQAATMPSSDPPTTQVMSGPAKRIVISITNTNIFMLVMKIHARSSYRRHFRIKAINIKMQNTPRIRFFTKWNNATNPIIVSGNHMPHVSGIRTLAYDSAICACKAQAMMKTLSAAIAQVCVHATTCQNIPACR